MRRRLGICRVTRTVGLMLALAGSAWLGCGTTGKKATGGGGGAAGANAALGGGGGALASQGGVSGGGTGPAGSAGGLLGGTAGGGNAGGAGGGSMACASSGGDDPFAGTWQGTQANETWIVMNRGTCSEWTGRINGTICDSCVGQYRADGAASLSCSPLNGCGSPAHDDTGKLTRTACSLSYSYDYPGGSSSWTGQWVSNDTTLVCK